MSRQPAGEPIGTDRDLAMELLVTLGKIGDIINQLMDSGAELDQDGFLTLPPGSTFEVSGTDILIRTYDTKNPLMTKLSERHLEEGEFFRAPTVQVWLVDDWLDGESGAYVFLDRRIKGIGPASQLERAYLPLKSHIVQMLPE